MKKLMLIFVLLFSVSCEKLNNQELKIGQTWIYANDLDDPFIDTSRIDHNKIIDIKGNYVLYIRNGRETLSSKKDLFLFGSRLIKEQEK